MAVFCGIAKDGRNENWNKHPQAERLLDLPRDLPVMGHFEI